MQSNRPHVTLIVSIVPPAIFVSLNLMSPTYYGDVATDPLYTPFLAAGTVDLLGGDDIILDGTVIAAGKLTLFGGFPILSPDAIGNIFIRSG